MIPYEKYSDDLDYLVPGSIQKLDPRKIEQPAPLTIQEVFPCPGCGRGLDTEGICGECESERDLVVDMWDFENHRRAQLPVGPWTPRAVAAAVIAGALAVYLVYEFAPIVADWICGGTR